MIKPIQESNMRGELQIIEYYHKRPPQGEVIATGPDVQEVMIGDVILYGRYSGEDFIDGDDKLVILRECDILALYMEDNDG